MRWAVWVVLVLVSGPLGCATVLDDARAARAEGSLDEAEALYREAMQDPKLAGAARDELAELWLAEARKVARDDPERGEKKYRAVLAFHPSHDKALTELVRLLLSQKRHDDAMVALDTATEAGECPSCKRLVAVVLIGRGELRLEAKQWDEARADFERAFELMPDAGTALTIVSTHRGDSGTEAAAQALTRAASVIGTSDVDAQRKFSNLRRELVLAAVRRKKLELADRLLELRPIGVDDADQASLLLKVAVDLRARGEPDHALERLEALLTAYAKEELAVDEDTRRVARQQIVELRALRGAKRLRAGDTEKADSDFARALELSPKNTRLQLQRVLTVAAAKSVNLALAALKQVPASADGRAEVLAVLESRKAESLLRRNEIADGRAALERAQAARPDAPEVHVAQAHLLAKLPVDDLSRRDRKVLRKRGLVSYPHGRVNRYGEALSELDWARKQAEGQGRGYPFRAPWLDSASERLENEIRAFYPFEVKFHSDPATVLTLKNPRTTGKDVQITGPGRFSDQVFLGPGKSHTLTIPDPGVVRLRAGRTDVAFVAEPYTDVTVDL